MSIKGKSGTETEVLPPLAKDPGQREQQHRNETGKPRARTNSTGEKASKIRTRSGTVTAERDGATPAASSKASAAETGPKADNKPVVKPEPAKAQAIDRSAAKVEQEAAKPPSEAAPEPEPVPPHLLAPEGEVAAVIAADHRDPFGFLGMHHVSLGGPLVVRAFLPQALAVTVVDRVTGDEVAMLDRIRQEGMFAGAIAGRRERFAYRLRLDTSSGMIEMEDPYRFPPILSAEDVHLLAEGNHLRSYQKLGAHPAVFDGVEGIAFAVWAPNAGRVSVIGEFNAWDGRRHGMRLRHDCGVWEIFVPDARPDQLYKYEIKSGTNVRLTDKCDPYAFFVEKSPGSASIVCDLSIYRWGDSEWMRSRKAANAREAPTAIYEVHLGSWRRKPEEGHRWLTYRELAQELVDYVRDLEFTHIELLPVSEFDFDGSLGYQPFAPYAPTSRWGTPDDFRKLVDRCHQAGIGVIADWVPNHFSDDPHGLRTFDGTHLYEHPDPRQRRHPGWNTLTFDHGRREVANYLLSNALFWLDAYHLDGLRVNSVASMLYLDYGRARGEWMPNRFGGHENLEAIEFLRRMNEVVYGHHPDTFTIAEESSGWPRVSHPTVLGGLGFGYKWNTSWVRDTLRYMSRNPVHRKYYHDELTHGPAGAFQENFILPFSHDEVTHGKGSLLRTMPGDRWQRFANLRVCYALMYTHPGKKLMFMGNEFAQEREWNSEISLDWHVLGDPLHQGIQRLVRDLNSLYRSTPALHELDCEPNGFVWIDCNDTEQSVITFIRHGRKPEGFVVVVCNFTPVVRNAYRIGVPEPGFYEERLNTDAEAYGGGNVGNFGGVEAIAEPMHGRPCSLTLRLPPFSAVILRHVGDRGAMRRRNAFERGVRPGVGSDV